jgi:cell division septum initiation protein DivIVA
VEGLRKTWTGNYRAADVDRLLMKLRCDYESRMKEQKLRILELRSENQALREQLKKHQADAQYISKIIARAEQTAKMIIEQAEMKAMRCLAESEAMSHRMQMKARDCQKRLLRLKKASESVYLAACRAVPEESPDESARAVARAVLSLYDSMPRQEKNNIPG